MIFDCHFRHAIVINRLSIQINRHLSTPIDCHRRPVIQSFDYFINQLPPIAQRRPAIQSFDYFINRLPRVYTMGWDVSRLRRWSPNFQERLRQLDFLDMNHEAT